MGGRGGAYWLNVLLLPLLYCSVFLAQYKTRQSQDTETKQGMPKRQSEESKGKEKSRKKGKHPRDKMVLVTHVTPRGYALVEGGRREKGKKKKGGGRKEESIAMNSNNHVG